GLLRDAGSVSCSVRPGENRGIAFAGGFAAAELQQSWRLGVPIAHDREQTSALEVRLVHFVAGANQDARGARVDIRNDESESLKVDVEMWRDPEGVVLAAIDREEAFPLFSGRRKLPGRPAQLRECTAAQRYAIRRSDD